MSALPRKHDLVDPSGEYLDEDYPVELPVDRRGFLQTLGAGILISVSAEGARAQRRGRGQRGPTPILTRVHLGEDGAITVMTGKVELGQGARTEISQAAAEELNVGADKIRLVMADTDLCPDDGVTAGSRTTPGTIPPVRKGAAAAKNVLLELAAKQLEVDASELTTADATIEHPSTKRRLTFGEVVKGSDVSEALKQPIPDDVQLTSVDKWKVMGVSTPRVNARDLVTGAHRYPSDITVPGMLHGKLLRPPSYGATLKSLDTSAAEAMEGVTVVREGDFIGCVAPTSFAAAQAVKALTKSATWETVPQPSSDEIWEHLRKHASGRPAEAGVEEAMKGADKTLSAEYHTAYIQHAPMEPGVAVAQWEGDKVTVWDSTRGPHRVRSQVAQALGVPMDRVRIIVPDSGGGFGMKSGDQIAVEAARLARAVGKPVRVAWTREEEFTWAYFRPAALIDARGGLDADGNLIAWDFVNINSGGSGLRTPYEIPNASSRYHRSNSPLRQAPYRALASTANNFARESFMDELAHAAGADPLAFRLKHLQHERLRSVLEAAAERFHWNRRKAATGENVGVGIACGTEKASYVAGCAEVAVDLDRKTIDIRHFCEVFECGAILNPSNLRSQVIGCILMGLGAVLREEMRFKDGKILNARFSDYQVPRFEDVPELDIHLLNRPDISSAGAGETPIMAIAPAVGNAIFDAVGVRMRELPMRL